MAVSFQYLADTYNSHVRDWRDVTQDFIASEGSSSDAFNWLTDRNNTPSLETIKYVRSKTQLGMYEEVPDPNPDMTEAFRRIYLPTPLELEKLANKTPRKQVLRTPLPLFSLLDYALACNEELNTQLQEKGFAASHIIPRFNTGLFSHLEAVGLQSVKINQTHSGLIARVLNHLHGAHGRIFNTDDSLRGMKFHKECLLGKWQVAQNQRYIKMQKRIIQV